MAQPHQTEANFQLESATNLSALESPGTKTRMPSTIPDCMKTPIHSAVESSTLHVEAQCSHLDLQSGLVDSVEAKLGHQESANQPKLDLIMSRTTQRRTGSPHLPPSLSVANQATVTPPLIMLDVGSSRSTSLNKLNVPAMKALAVEQILTSPAPDLPWETMVELVLKQDPHIEPEDLMPAELSTMAAKRMATTQVEGMSMRQIRFFAQQRLDGPSIVGETLSTSKGREGQV